MEDKHAHMCTCKRRPDINVGCLPQSHSSVLTKAGAHHLHLADWTVDPKDPSVSVVSIFSIGAGYRTQVLVLR